MSRTSQHATTKAARLGLTLITLFVALVAAVAVSGRAYADEKPPSLAVKFTRENGKGDVLEELGTETFSSVQVAWDHALARATDGSREDSQFVVATIVLGKDWMIESELVIPKDTGKWIRVDLNGHCLRRYTGGKKVKNGGVFRVEAKGTLVIVDSNPKVIGYRGIRGGVITGGASTNGSGGITVKPDGRLTIAGGTIYRCITDDHGGGIKLESEGQSNTTLRMNGGRIYFCQTVGALSNCHGGGIYADLGDFGTFVLNDARIDSCYSEDNGGGIYVENGAHRTMNMDNVQFYGNHCADNGGALYVNNALGIFVNKCRFSTNEAKGDGGGVYVDGGTGCRVWNCTFYRNKSFRDGGGAYINNDYCSFVDTSIVANSASRDGGGMYVDSRYDVALKGLMRIFKNDGRGTHDNLTLQDGNASRAYAYLGGLYDGSRVGLSSTAKNVRYAYGATSRDLAYLFSDAGGELKVQNETPVVTPFYSSSVFGGGQGSYLVLGGGLALVGGVATYTLAKKLSKDREARS